MKTLKDYKNLIRQTVKEINDKDVNWKWSVKSISDDKALIQWGYLDYCEEKNNCFQLVVHNDYVDDDYPDEVFVTARVPDGSEMIEGSFVTDAVDKRAWQSSWEYSIRHLLTCIASYAHIMY